MRGERDGRWERMAATEGGMGQERGGEHGWEM